MSLLNELKRRNVIRVGTAYVLGAWLVIQVVATIFPAFGIGDIAVRVIIIIFAIGLVPTLILSWIFELTPEGLKRERDVDRTQSIIQRTGKKLDRMIILVLTLAVSYFALDKFILDPTRDLEMVEEATLQARTDVLMESFGDQSIAVLAFSDMSQGGDQEYLSDGIAEELLSLLAKIPELRVTSRSSAFAFKGKSTDIPTIARQLNVAHVLEGSVRKSGNRIRITAQLIEARTDTQLWSETYDRTLDDIFVIQDEISADVVNQLKITLLSPIPKARKTDPETFRLYLQATHLLNQLDNRNNAQAESLYQQALKLDPNFAPAWRELSRVYWRQVGAGSSAQEDIKRSRAALDRALEIDPDDAASLAYIAWQIMDSEADITRAVKLFERAIALGPTNENVIRPAVIFAGAIGHPNVAIKLGEYGIAHNPLCFPCYRNIIRAYRNAGNLNEAEAKSHIVQSLFDDKNDVDHGIILLLKNQPEAALASFVKIQEKSLRLIYMAMAKHDLGQLDIPVAEVATLLEASVEAHPWDVSLAYAWLGQIDTAFDAIEMAAQQMPLNVKDDDIQRARVLISAISRNPLFHQLHSDPRWQMFLEEYGVSDKQLANVQFSVVLPEW